MNGLYSVLRSKHCPSFCLSHAVIFLDFPSFSSPQSINYLKPGDIPYFPEWEYRVNRTTFPNLSKNLFFRRESNERTLRVTTFGGYYNSSMDEIISAGTFPVPPPRPNRVKAKVMYSPSNLQTLALLIESARIYSMPTAWRSLYLSRVYRTIMIPNAMILQK